MKQRPRTITLMVVLALLLGTGGTIAQDRQPAREVSITDTVASEISYQGVLKEDGSPVTGKRDMTFRLYSDDTCTTEVGSAIEIPEVAVVGGLFSLDLPVDPANVDGQALWLEVAVEGTAIACREILPVTYALSLRPGATISGEGSTSLLVRNTSTGTGANAIQGSASGESGQTYGVVGLSDSPAGRGVLGHAMATSGTAYGVAGRTDSSGDYAAGVRGHATAASGQTFGVVGRSDSSDDWATGVQGHASATSGQTYGVRGYSASTSGRGVAGHASATSGVTFGVYGQTDSSSDEAAGVRGQATAAIGITRGVYGRSDSYAGIGVYGQVTSQTGAGAGVKGEAASPGGIGVYGRASATTGSNAGVYGVTHSSDLYATGVAGIAAAGDGGAIGVFGQSTAPDGYGVYGAGYSGYGLYGLSLSGFAGFFDGDVHVNGMLTKSAGGFKIDHPLDPENRYLSHAFVESPDMMNVYNGNVVLDENGQAWVELPDYFEALNRDYRYQLTCIGGFAHVYIAQKIQDNRFQIAGGEPGLEVSWQVTGIRQDPWANANRIPVDEAKDADERGYYLNPEVYGQPASMGIHAPRDLE